MNSREFAKAWLQKEGLFDKDSDYDGWLGETAMSTVEFIASQGHSGASLFQLLKIVSSIYEAYGSDDHPIWKAFMESDEGKRLASQHVAKEVNNEQGTPAIENLQMDFATSLKGFLKDLRVSIDKDIQEASTIRDAIAQEKAKGGREVSLAITKLQEAKMWTGVALGEIGSKLPEQYRDEYKSTRMA